MSPLRRVGHRPAIRELKMFGRTPFAMLKNGQQGTRKTIFNQDSALASAETNLAIDAMANSIPDVALITSRLVKDQAARTGRYKNVWAAT